MKASCKVLELDLLDYDVPINSWKWGSERLADPDSVLRDHLPRHGTNNFSLHYLNAAYFRNASSQFDRCWLVSIAISRRSGHLSSCSYPYPTVWFVLFSARWLKLTRHSYLTRRYGPMSHAVIDSPLESRRIKYVAGDPRESIIDKFYQ